MNRAFLPLLAAAMLAIAACGGRAGKQAMQTTPESVHDADGDAADAIDPTSMDRRHGEIEQLAAKISEYGEGIGIRMSADKGPDDEGATTCELEHYPDECDDMCGLSESICRNSERICELANELAGNAWAAEQCESATRSCKRARIACCNCKQ